MRILLGNHEWRARYDKFNCTCLCSPLIYNPAIYACILLTVVHHTGDSIAVVTKYIWVMKHQTFYPGKFSIQICLFSYYVSTIEQWVDFSFAIVLGKHDHVFSEELEIAFIKRYDFCGRSTIELQTFISFYTATLFLKTIQLLWLVADLRLILMSYLQTLPVFDVNLICLTLSVTQGWEIMTIVK